jgi:hypothetical protein
VPLEGPAYFVSHGGAAFPELIIILQGYGITIELNGETFINSKTDVTSSTFAAASLREIEIRGEVFERKSETSLDPSGPSCSIRSMTPLRQLL